MLTSLLAALVTCAVCAAEVDVSNEQSNHNNAITLEDGDPKAEAFKFDSLLNELHSSQQEQGPLWTRGTVALPGWGNMYDMYQQHQDDAYSPDSQFSDGHSNKADDVFNAVERVERGGTSLNYVQAPDNALELDGYGHNSPTLSNDPWDDRGGPHHSQSKDRSEMNEDLEDGGQSFEDPKLGKQPIHDGGGRDWSGMNGNMGMYNMPGAMPWGGLSQQQKYLPTMSQQKLYNKINPMQNQMYGYGFNSPFWGNQQPWRSMYPTQLGLSYQGYGGMQGFGQLGAPMMGSHMLGGFNQFGSGFNQMAGANNQGFNKMAGTEQQGSNQAASQSSIEQNQNQQQQSHRQQPQQNPIASQQQHQYPQQTFKHEPPHGLHQTHPQRKHQAQPLRQRERYHQTHRQQPHHPQRNRQHERPHHPQRNRQHERPHHPQRNRQHERPHHPQRNRQHERPHHPQHNRQHERPHHPKRNRLHRPQPQNQAQSQHQARPERQHQAQSQLYQTQQSLKHRHQPSKHQSHNFKQHERPQNAQQQRQHLNQQQQSRRHQQQLYHQKQ